MVVINACSPLRFTWPVSRRIKLQFDPVQCIVFRFFAT